VDLLREGVRVLAQAVMETEVSSQIGAGPYERSSERGAYRNGNRTRTWDTRVGTIELKIPKVTAGAHFPSLLEPRRRAEKALHAVVVEAYVKGVSTRKVERAVARDPGGEPDRDCKQDAEQDQGAALHRERPTHGCPQPPATVLAPECPPVGLQVHDVESVARSMSEEAARERTGARGIGRVNIRKGRCITFSDGSSCETALPPRSVAPILKPDS
jgi:hypothetical protein